MAQWPDTAELAQHLNLGDEGNWEPTLDRVMAAAIDTVKEVRGNWDENVDEPDNKLANAALALAILMWTRPNADASSLLADPAFRTSMYGRRRVFGVA